MKIQLDTDNKTIKLEQDILLSKLVETLDKLLPNKEWKKFTLQTNTTIAYWNNPIVIREYPVYPKPYYPSWPWYMTGNDKYFCQGTTADYKVNRIDAKNNLTLKSGVYNLDII